MSDQLDKDKEVEAYTGAGRPSVRNNNIWTGIFILGVGAILLMRQSGVEFPFWFFTWPVLLITIGVFGAIKNNFHPGGWMAILAVGGIFLADRLVPGVSIQQYAWPLLLMAVGFWIIVRPKSHQHRFAQCRNNRRRAWRERNRTLSQDANTYTNDEFARVSSDSNEFVDTTSVFGGVKKMILSKNFRGGDITNVMGGTEINLMQADIQGKVVIDTTNFFGGTKLIVPSTWDVQSNVVTIFGGVDDKRQITSEPLQPNKIVQLSGVCIFGGIEIKSF
jgi:predicted membrane protein